MSIFRQTHNPTGFQTELNSPFVELSKGKNPFLASISEQWVGWKNPLFITQSHRRFSETQRGSRDKKKKARESSIRTEIGNRERANVKVRGRRLEDLS
eukprot:523684-Amorphochlora_amoeboformis.AAC.1